jgi:superfamily II DNA or RNA helicase
MTTQITLRYYQVDGLREIAQGLRDRKKVLYQCPTGAGKSTILSEIVRLYRSYNPDKRVIVLAHRKELIRQLHHRLGDFGLSSWALYGGIEKQPDHMIQVASIQTLTACKPDEWPTDVGLIVADESHHCAAKTWLSVFDRYPDALRLGVTATPCRGDGKPLREVFDHLILGPSVSKLIADGHLCEYDYYRGKSPKLSGIKQTAGDYNLKELGEAVSDTALLGNIVSTWAKYAFGKRTVVFAVNVEHSMQLRDRFRAIGVAAEHLDGKTPSAERDAIVSRFANGETMVLVNVGIISEGVDIPAIECVQMARPTKSLALYLQCVGRALRPVGDKRALILDHGNCYVEFGLPCEDRKWTLEGKIKNTQWAPPKVDEELEEFIEITDRKQEIIEQEAVFEKLTASKNRSQKIENDVLRIIAAQERKEYKKIWAYHRLIESHGHDLTLDHLKALAKHLGYKWQWAVHKFEDFTQNHLASEENIPW